MMELSHSPPRRAGAPRSWWPRHAGQLLALVLGCCLSGLTPARAAPPLPPDSLKAWLRRPDLPDTARVHT